MKSQIINVALDQFAVCLNQAATQQMTLSLRASLLREGKKLQETLQKNLVLHKNTRELFFLNTLEHFIACARLERADMLQVSCLAMQDEITRGFSVSAVDATNWRDRSAQGFSRVA